MLATVAGSSRLVRRAARGGDSGKYGFMASDDVMERVRALRQQGYSPKEIARALRMPPAAVAPLVRAIAAEAGADSPRVGADSGRLLGEL
jgi:hypothetical protein